MLKPSGFGVDFPQFVVRKSTAKYSSSKVDGISTSLVYMLRKKKNINNIKNTILPSSGTHMAVSLWFLSVLHRARLQRGHVLCDHCCQSHGEQMHCHGWGRWVRWCVFWGLFYALISTGKSAPKSTWFGAGFLLRISLWNLAESLPENFCSNSATCVQT